MSTHNGWEFGKTGFKWAAIAATAVTVIGAVATGGLSAIGVGLIGTAVKAAAMWGLAGGSIGGIIGAFTRDKERETVSIETPGGRVINVSAQELAQEQEQESTRFRDMVAASRGGQLRR